METKEKKISEKLNEEGFSTTFPSDFTIADAFGVKAIRDTFNRAFNEWKRDYRYLTHLVIALNHKIWEWRKKNPEYAKLYDELWRKADKYACDMLEGDAASYFYRMTD